MVGGYNLFWITIYKVVDIACFLAMDPCIDPCSRLRVCKIINVRGLDSLGSEAAAVPLPHRFGLGLALAGTTTFSSSLGTTTCSSSLALAENRHPT